MKNYIKKVSLAVFCLFFILTGGCGPSEITREGQNLLNEIKGKYDCYEIITGKGVEIDRDNNRMKFVNVRFCECFGALNYDSIQKYKAIREDILQKIAPFILKKNEYDAIALEFDYDKNSPFGTKTYYYKFDNTSFILSDSTIFNKKKM